MCDEIEIVIKKETWNKPILFCDVDDQKLSLLGDSGAVGRIVAKPDKVVLDLKGRQYECDIQSSGHTMMLLNMAPPVGVKEKDKDKKHIVARTDMVTNEITHLTFERDILSGLMGEFTGGLSHFSEMKAGESDEEVSIFAYYGLNPDPNPHSFSLSLSRLFL